MPLQGAAAVRVWELKSWVLVPLQGAAACLGGWALMALAPLLCAVGSLGAGAAAGCRLWVHAFSRAIWGLCWHNFFRPFVFLFVSPPHLSVPSFSTPHISSAAPPTLYRGRFTSRLPSHLHRIPRPGPCPKPGSLPTSYPNKKTYPNQVLPRQGPRLPTLQH